MDKPHSETATTLKLALIQKRCAELLEEPDEELAALSLEESDDQPGFGRDYFIQR